MYGAAPSFISLTNLNVTVPAGVLSAERGIFSYAGSSQPMREMKFVVAAVDRQNNTISVMPTQHIFRMEQGVGGMPPAKKLKEDENEPSSRLLVETFGAKRNREYLRRKVA